MAALRAKLVSRGREPPRPAGITIEAGSHTLPDHEKLAILCRVASALGFQHPGWTCAPTPSGEQIITMRMRTNSRRTQAEQAFREFKAYAKQQHTTKPP